MDNEFTAPAGACLSAANDDRVAKLGVLVLHASRSVPGLTSTEFIVTLAGLIGEETLKIAREIDGDPVYLGHVSAELVRLATAFVTDCESEGIQF